MGGVRAVADEIEVNIMGSYERIDSQIAEAAANALEWNYSVPKKIKVSVNKGWITLKGEADWDFQRTAAKNAVSLLMGVTGVINEISIKSNIHHDQRRGFIRGLLRFPIKTPSGPHL